MFNIDYNLLVKLVLLKHNIKQQDKTISGI